MVHHKALAMDNLNSSSIILPRYITSAMNVLSLKSLPRVSSHLQHQPNRQHRRNNSLRMRRLFKYVLCHAIKPNDLSMVFLFCLQGSISQDPV